MVIYVYGTIKKKHSLKYFIDKFIRSASPYRLNTRKTKHKFVEKTLENASRWNCFHIHAFLLPTYIL